MAELKFGAEVEAEKLPEVPEVIHPHKVMSVEPGQTPFKDDMVEITEGSEHLPVDLTEDQKKEFGQKLAQLIEEIERQTGQLKFLSTEIKSKIQAAEAQMRDYANKLRAGYEILPVRVEVYRDYREGSVSSRRLDTGEIYTRRPMTTIEKQRVLFPKEAKNEEGVLDGVNSEKIP